MHLTCAPGSIYTHMIDKTSVIPLQWQNVQELNQYNIHYYTQRGGLEGPNTNDNKMTSSSIFDFHRHDDWGIRMP
jgi:hypothetical protein